MRAKERDTSTRTMHSQRLSESAGLVGRATRRFGRDRLRGRGLPRATEGGRAPVQRSAPAETYSVYVKQARAIRVLPFASAPPSRIVAAVAVDDD